MSPGPSPSPSRAALPPWRSVLAVVAHPDDESFGLGAVLTSFIDAGAGVAVLCLTQGEASTLRGVEGDLTTVRVAELRAAADALGVGAVELRDFPDGDLSSVALGELVAVVEAEALGRGIDGLLGFDVTGVTGHPDHAAATRAALAAGARLGLPVLGWTLPLAVAQQLNEDFGARFEGHADAEIDVQLTVSRERQLRAVACHPSQAVPGSVLWRRLELLGDREYLRHLPLG